MKPITILYSIFFIIIATAYLTAMDKKPFTLVVTVERVLLDKPSFRGNAVTMLSKGEKVQLLEKGEQKEKYLNFEEYWYHVLTGPGKMGWIYGAYVRNLSGERIDDGGDKGGKPAVEGDIPKTIRLMATPVQFKSRQSLLGVPESGRYKYSEYRFSAAESSLLKKSGFYIRSVRHDRLPTST